MRTLATISILLLSLSTFGQINRSLHWRFGWKVGLDFSSGFPVADTTGTMESIEGTSSISDTAGNLLFYSNGEAVWNRNNDTMPNGGGLWGFHSSEQSCLFVPKPGSNSLYYLFNSGHIDSYYPFSYSIIDLNLDGGLGDVTASKNILLFTNGTEGIGGTMHCNGKDYWIMGRQIIDTVKFYAYLLDSSGISAPVISHFNLHSTYGTIFGFITFSQDGSLMAFSSFGNPLSVFNFDTQTGMLTFKDSIAKYPNEQLYANRISPDKTRLYITSWGANGNCYLSQFDLTAANIAASRVDIDSVDYSHGSPDGYGFLGDIQIAPDGKMYYSRYKQTPPYVNNTYWSLDSLDVIHNPNGLGLSCNLQRNYVYLNHRPTEHGLPNFISNFTSPAIPISTCETSVSEYGDLEFAIFPNPFIDKVTLSIPPNAEMKLQLFDICEREVVTTINFNSTSIEIERGNLSSGIYLLKLWNGKELLTTTKLIAL